MRMLRVNMKNAANFFGRLATPAILNEKLKACRDAGCRIERDKGAGTVIVYCPLADTELGIAAGEVILRAIQKDPHHWIICYRKGAWAE